ARVTKTESGAPCVDIDSRHDNGTWHTGIFIPAGLLKTGEDFVITVDYEVIEHLTADNYFYVFARSDKLGLGADRWQTWSGEAGTRGVAKLLLSADSDDFSVTAGICKQGAIRILGMKIVRG